jgi:hypothetical protein
MSITFFLEQTDVLKQTHIVITDNQVAETPTIAENALTGVEI